MALLLHKPTVGQSRLVCFSNYGLHAAHLQTQLIDQMSAFSGLGGSPPKRVDSVVCEQSNSFDVTISRYENYHTRCIAHPCAEQNRPLRSIWINLLSQWARETTITSMWYLCSHDVSLVFLGYMIKISAELVDLREA